MNNLFFKNLIIGTAVSLVFFFSGHTVSASLFEGSSITEGFFDRLPPNDIEANEETLLEDEITNLANDMTNFEDQINNIYDLSDNIDYYLDNFETLGAPGVLEVNAFIDDNSSFIASFNIFEMDEESIKLTGRYNSLMANIAEVGQENLTDIQSNQIDEIEASIENMEPKISSVSNIKEKFNQLVDLRTPESEESEEPKEPKEPEKPEENIELTEESIDDAISIVSQWKEKGNFNSEDCDNVISDLMIIKSKDIDNLPDDIKKEVEGILSRMNRHDISIILDDAFAPDVDLGNLKEHLKEIAKKVCAPDVVAKETETKDTPESSSVPETGYAPSSYTVSFVKPQTTTGEENKKDGKEEAAETTDSSMSTVFPEASSKIPSTDLETNESNQKAPLFEKMTDIDILPNSQKNNDSVVNNGFGEDRESSVTVVEEQVSGQNYTQIAKAGDTAEIDTTGTYTKDTKEGGIYSLFASDLNGSKEGILSKEVEQLLGIKHTEDSIDDEMVGKLVRVLIEDKGFPPLIAGALVGALVGVSTETQESLAAYSVNTVSKMVTALSQIDNANLSLNASDLKQLASLVFNISKKSGINIDYLARLVTSLSPGEAADVFSLTSDCFKNSTGNIGTVLKSVARKLSDYREEYVYIKFEDLIAMIHTLQNDVGRRNSAIGSNQPYTPSSI